MGMPALLVQNQTGTSSIWFADWMQTPFSLSIGAIATGTPTYNVEYTLDNIEIVGGPGQAANATTAANATWFQSSVTATTASAAGNIASPVRAVRINIVTSSSTAFVTVNLIQSTFGR